MVGLLQKKLVSPGNTAGYSVFMPPLPYTVMPTPKRLDRPTL